MRRFALATAFAACAISSAGAAPWTAGEPLPLDPRRGNELAFFTPFEPWPPAPRAAPAHIRATPETTRALVPYSGGQAPGTILISTEQRRLFLVQPNGTALRYTIGVGRDGFQWGGRHTVSRKEKWPDWRPPAEMLKRRPDLPRYMAGGEDNPLGARAIYIGSTLYRIHGSNEPGTIGQAVSSGCFRMLNADVIDLYERVRVGAKVVVLR